MFPLYIFSRERVGSTVVVGKRSLSLQAASASASNKNKDDANAIQVRGAIT